MVLELREGQTLAIAGLLQSKTNATTLRVPFLGDLPLVGGLFSSNSHQVVETELIVLVTPELRRADGGERGSPHRQATRCSARTIWSSSSWDASKASSAENSARRSPSTTRQAWHEASPDGESVGDRDLTDIPTGSLQRTLETGLRDTRPYGHCTCRLLYDLPPRGPDKEDRMGRERLILLGAAGGLASTVLAASVSAQTPVISGGPVPPPPAIVAPGPPMNRGWNRPYSVLHDKFIGYPEAFVEPPLGAHVREDDGRDEGEGRSSQVHALSNGLPQQVERSVSSRSEPVESHGLSGCGEVLAGSDPDREESRSAGTGGIAPGCRVRDAPDCGHQRHSGTGRHRPVAFPRPLRQLRIGHDHHPLLS